MNKIKIGFKLLIGIPVFPIYLIGLILGSITKNSINAIKDGWTDSNEFLLFDGESDV